MKKIRIPKSGSPDFVFLGFLIILVIFGLVMLTSASSDIAKLESGDSMYYLKHQMLNGLSIGMFGFLVGYFLYYRIWEKISIPLLVVGIIGLCLVFTPLVMSVKGGDRWVDLKLFSFQPGEFMKLAFLVYLSAWVGKNQERGKSFFGGFLPFMVLVGAVMLLLVFQPATSTAALIFGASIITYFVAGAKPRFFVAMVLIGALSFSALVFFDTNDAGENYRLKRIMTFLHPEDDPLNKGYHINQALNAIGSGEVFGVGFGKSTTKLHYLPEPIGDSIFAVIAEELGFVGAVGFLLFFLAFLWRGFRIATRAPDNFGKLLVTGFMSVLGLQAFVNIGAISGVIPLTGVPLPFVSYGGTALAIFLTMSGIIMNVSKYRR
ncbi:cell division protein FtsW [Candidatus Parcubacteria bacterium]|jgi:cell division protein FtsW|nr:MAG: cell division protein FtsW [Candidatus Parcubacteria bacterium]